MLNRLLKFVGLIILGEIGYLLWLYIHVALEEGWGL